MSKDLWVYRDSWGKKIPKDQIILYYSCNWMEDSSRKHYLGIKERQYFRCNSLENKVKK